MRDVPLTVLDPGTMCAVQVPALWSFLGLCCREAPSPDEIVRLLRAHGGLTAIVQCWEVDASGRLSHLEIACRPKDTKQFRGWRPWQPRPPLAERLEWERPGWYAQACARIDAALASLGVPYRGSPVQVCHSPIGAVLRAGTPKGAFWYKEGPRIFAQEAAILTALASIVKTVTLPNVLARGETWWLSADLGRERPNPRINPYATLAELQIASRLVMGADGLKHVPRRSLRALPDACASLAARRDLLDDRRADALAAHLPLLDALVAEVDALGFPETFTHGDFHGENRRWIGESWAVYDWTDSMVTHPFLDLALLHRFEQPEAIERGLEAFRGVWCRAGYTVSKERLSELSRVLGGAHQALGYSRISDAINPGARSWLATRIADWLELVCPVR